ncbi:protein takeout [Eurosta solidaginis]|uniref:protein takeout n=1 Tax=Eurosta solidaginis TaxID=178769 RepID=UPI003530E07B
MSVFAGRSPVLKGLLIVVLACVTGVCSLDYYAEKPSYLQTCRINDPEFVKCSTASIQKLMDQLSIGIPEITEVIGPFDPLKTKEIQFAQDNQGAVQLRANLTNMIATGLSKLVIKESRVSKKDYSWETKIYIPKLRLDGHYKMAGKILLIPLNGAGRMFIEIDKLNILMRTKTRLYEKGGFTFYNVTKIRIDLNPGGVKTNFENIFNGNSKEVERSTNLFFNENWRDFFEALRPLVTKTVETTLLDILQKLFNLIPANFFVEDIPTSEQLYGKKKEQ